MMAFLSSALNDILLIVVFLLMISVLVAAHEMGHYLFARLFGMGVEEFAIGMGKRPFVWMRRTYKIDDPRADGQTETTEFTIRPLPIGGFVRVKGMVPEEDGSEVNELGGFYSKAIWKRIVVLIAGPAFSVLAGIVLLIPLYMTVGVERAVNEPRVGQILQDSPADKAGLHEGDLIKSIDGVAMPTYYDFIETVKDKAGVPLRFVVDRKGKDLAVVVTPEWGKTDSLQLDRNLEPTGTFERHAQIGFIRLDATTFVRLGLWDATSAAVSEPVREVRGLIGLVSRPQNASVAVSGPVSMVEMTGYAMQRGISNVILLAAALSISVGIFNLLPISPLDGGQILVALVELLRGGRRLSIQVQAAIGAVGFTLTILLVASTWFIDVRRAISPDPGPKLKKSPAVSVPVKRG